MCSVWSVVSDVLKESLRKGGGTPGDGWSEKLRVQERKKTILREEIL